MAPNHRYILCLALSILSICALAGHEEEFMQALESSQELAKVAVQIFKANENNFDPDFKITSGKNVGATPLFYAAGYEEWDVVRRMLELHPNADVNASPTTGPYRGATPLSFTADFEEWDIVRRMLELNPNANVDASRMEGKDRGKTSLWFAAGRMRWDIVELMLRLRPNADVNATPIEGPDRGKTPLYFAASADQWDIVRRIMELQPKANVDASPAEGPRSGATPLWFAAAWKQWDILRGMLESHPNTNVNAAPTEGITVLLLAAVEKQWEIASLILAGHPEANLEAAAQEGPLKGKSVLNSMAQAPAALKKLCVIHLMNQDKEDTPLRARLENPGWGGELVTELQKIFRRATVAFTNLVPPGQSQVQESSKLDQFYRDLKDQLALTTLREEDADLKQVPGYILRQLLIRFMSVYKKVDYDERSIELVAAKVLDALAPMDARDREAMSVTMGKKIPQVRKWIIAEIKNAVQRGLLSGAPDSEVRDGIARVLSAQPLSKITRTWIRATVRAYGQQRMRDEEAMPGRKRPMEDG